MVGLGLLPGLSRSKCQVLKELSQRFFFYYFIDVMILLIIIKPMFLPDIFHRLSLFITL